jgi:hypothetical protein
LIRKIVNAVTALDGEFAKAYTGRFSIAPERLLQALLIRGL